MVIDDYVQLTIDAKQIVDLSASRNYESNVRAVLALIAKYNKQTAERCARHADGLERSMGGAAEILRSGGSDPVQFEAEAEAARIIARGIRGEFGLDEVSRSEPDVCRDCVPADERNQLSA
jgi:hypothetical protein